MKSIPHTSSREGGPLAIFGGGIVKTPCGPDLSPFSVLVLSGSRSFFAHTTESDVSVTVLRWNRARLIACGTVPRLIFFPPRTAMGDVGCGIRVPKIQNSS